MIANYHTHTARCHHATGADREYIEYAIARGITTLGFSDHVPMPFADGHQSGFRIRIEELEEYVRALETLREEYADRIKILIGFEAEYYPDVFEDMLKLLEPYNYNYLILGQHFLGNEENEHSSPSGTDDPRQLKRYVDQVLTGLATGRYTYLAHPDMFRFTGDEEIYQEQMEHLCRGCLDMGIPLELNMLGILGHRHYPSDRFFRIVARVGNPVILGCDAHAPDTMAEPSTLAAAQDLAARHGLRILSTVELRDPKRGWEREEKA